MFMMHVFLLDIDDQEMLHQHYKSDSLCTMSTWQRFCFVLQHVCMCVLLCEKRGYADWFVTHLYHCCWGNWGFLCLKTNVLIVFIVRCIICFVARPQRLVKEARWGDTLTNPPRHVLLVLKKNKKIFLHFSGFHVCV